MKNLGILIFESLFLGLALLTEARQGINRNISFFLTIIDLNVISKQFLGLVDLAKAYFLHIYYSTEIVMIIKDEDLVFATF